MRKFIIWTVLAFMGFATATAQNQAGRNYLFNNPYNEGYFGVRVGGDVICPGDVKSGPLAVDMFNIGPGFEAGVIYNLPVVANLYLEPGAKFFRSSYSAQTALIGTHDSYDNLSIVKCGVRLPLLVGYHLDPVDNLKVSIFAGPEIEHALSGTSYLSNYFGSGEGDIFEDDTHKRTNVLLDLGAGLTVKRFYIGLTAAIGLRNLLNEEQVSMRESHVTLSVGYNFK